MDKKGLEIGRIKIIGVFMCLAAFVIVVRLYYLQVVKADVYQALADKQYVRKGQTLFDRGSIFFQTKSGDLVSAATLKSGYTVALQPKNIVHPEDIFNVLSGIMPVDEKTLLHKLSTDGSYSEIARRVSSSTAVRIQSLGLAGVDVYPERWRYYPAETTAANVIGFVGYNDDGVTQSGRYGLEKYYNDILVRNESDVNVNFFAEIFSNIGSSFFNSEKTEGDVVTTIEPSVEAELEREITSVMATWKSDLTGGIVMDPITGEIYAMAASPSFDPNNFSKETNQSVFANPMVSSRFEMGSIIKPLAMAAALDAGVITPETKYDDTGSVVINGSKISNYDGRARGVISMQRVLNESLNVGMAFVAQKLGNATLTKYFKSYDFGEETGIDLPNEIRGQISNLDAPRDLEHATAAFGQGISLTPIGTIRALSALGNGGYLPNPHIVKRVEYVSGEVATPSYSTKTEVLKPETSDTITGMLINVVDQALLGGQVKQARYSIAAKTGTAQIPSPDGGYYKDRYLHSFFGYFPAYKPRFIIFMFTVYPKGAEYASHTLTEPFINLVKFLINYYNVVPDR